MQLRAWTVIPVIGAVAALGSLALGYPAVAAVAAGALAAAVAAAIRAHAGDAPAVLAGAATGALVAAAAALTSGAEPARAALAGAAAAWTYAELVRPAPADARPAVAVMPATIAALLDPAYAALILFAGVRLWRAPQRRGRWPIVVPVAGALVLGLAALALRAPSGALATLATTWTGAPRAHAAPTHLLTVAGDALGPLAALAALVGAALAASRGLAALLVWAALVVGALASSIHQGAVAPAVLVLAGLAAGIATARLAALVNHPAGQACVGATAGFVLLVTPAWTLWLAMR